MPARPCKGYVVLTSVKHRERGSPGLAHAHHDGPTKWLADVARWHLALVQLVAKAVRWAIEGPGTLAYNPRFGPTLSAARCSKPGRRGVATAPYCSIHSIEYERSASISFHMLHSSVDVPRCRQLYAMSAWNAHPDEAQ